MDIVKQNTLLLLKRRGYNEVIEQTCDYIVAIASLDKNNPIIVFFIQHTKVKIDIIKMIISKAKFISNVIIIHEKPLTPDAKYTVSNSVVYRFEMFTFDEMSYDPIELVPEHSLYIEEVLKEKHRLPMILTTDIIVRYYNFPVNSVLKIVDGDYIHLRRVV